MFNRIIYTIAIFTLLLSFLSQPVRAENATPEALVEELHSKLLHTMQQAGELGYQGRYDYIAPAIEEMFDFPIIAKVILSRYWKELGEDDKNTFISSLAELTIATYASRFNGFSDESFMTNQVESLKKGRKLVKTTISSNAEETKLDYLMQQRDGNWFIISVIANGVNDLSLKRAEYSAVIKEQGFAQLISEIRHKIENLDKS